MNDRLRMKPEESIILMSEAPLNAKENRQKLMEIIFDKFNASSKID